MLAKAKVEAKKQSEETVAKPQPKQNWDMAFFLNGAHAYPGGLAGMKYELGEDEFEIVSFCRRKRKALKELGAPVHLNGMVDVHIKCPECVSNLRKML